MSISDWAWNQKPPILDWGGQRLTLRMFNLGWNLLPISIIQHQNLTHICIWQKTIRHRVSECPCSFSCLCPCTCLHTYVTVFVAISTSVSISCSCSINKNRICPTSWSCSMNMDMTMKMNMSMNRNINMIMNMNMSRTIVERTNFLKVFGCLNSGLVQYRDSKCRYCFYFNNG
jgi:hypothetical protein